jgi:general secretion pathway protein G
MIDRPRLRPRAIGPEETTLRTKFAPPRRVRRASGLTIVEFMLAVAALAALAALAWTSYAGYRDRVRVATAAYEIASISALVSAYAVDNRALPESLAAVGEGARVDPWGRPYRYVNHEAKHSRGEWRRDKNIVPINSDFDLFSEGTDGASRPPLTAKVSRDDIVRANNGRFIGLASDYDP